MCLRDTTHAAEHDCKHARIGLDRDKVHQVGPVYRRQHKARGA
jgi:hypothetical protein